MKGWRRARPQASPESGYPQSASDHLTSVIESINQRRDERQVEIDRVLRASAAHKRLADARANRD